MSDYIHKTNIITQEIIEKNSDIFISLLAFDTYFRTTLWRNVKSFDPIAMTLALNAYMLLLGGVRVAMTGHVTATFPVLRTALESACYGYLIAKQPSLSSVWSNRHTDAAARKSCRKAFGSAVTEVAKRVERDQPGGGLWIADAYDVSIDFGAHPNVKSVFGHVMVQDEKPDDPFYRLNFAGLYGADHRETQRMLIGCLDFALAIGVVSTRALNAPDQEHQRQLTQLNDLKNRVSDEFFKNNGQ